MSAGWQSSLETLQATAAGVIQGRLEDFVHGYSPEQVYAWKEEIPLLQREAGELIATKPPAAGYGAILEYKLPYEERRPDVIVLANNSVIVLELKGKSSPSQADLDQVSAYARDLRAYHRACAKRKVHAILVPTRSHQLLHDEDDIIISSPDRLDSLIGKLSSEPVTDPVLLNEFLADDSYQPLPTLVEAARELFESRTIREIWRARAATDPAVQAISDIAHSAAKTKSRHLVLISGVPGAGKTLVGMRAVHAKYLDDLAVQRGSNKPSVPGLYLTGNGPLSEVLQYELKKAGGGGRTFVRHIKGYLSSYANNSKTPPEHLLVFDEAQRAFSPERVRDVHKDWPDAAIRSEPELFVSICDRMPEWSVMIGLIGSGQEIHLGEEDGIGQWREAIEKSSNDWTIHCPSSLASSFKSSTINDDLHLKIELRFHTADHLHEFTDQLLSNSNNSDQISGSCRSATAPFGDHKNGIKLYTTRDLELAKSYLKSRYADYKKARYGILASSRDRDLPRFGVDNDYLSTNRVRIGPWFTEDESNTRSCRQLLDVVTEFGCQGLELDMAIVAWGTDLIRIDGTWSIKNAKRYKPTGHAQAKDPYQMRINAYRVLLTRGRDGTIIYVPKHPALDETFEYFVNCGFRILNR